MKLYLSLFLIGLIGGIAILTTGTALAHKPVFTKVTICHATHSESNPYETITIDNQGQLNGHKQHDGDIIPAPEDGCPGPEASPTPTFNPCLQTEVALLDLINPCEPTATPTASPTATLTPTETPIPTPTAQPAGDGKSDGQSDGLGCASHPCYTNQSGQPLLPSSNSGK